MSIREQAYRAHAFLQAHGIRSVTRSHVHELLAAAAGYSTYAAFQHDAAWCDVPFRTADIEPDASALQTRCAGLGVSTEDARRTAELIPVFQHESGYAPVRFDALIAAAEGDEDNTDWQEWVWVHLVEPVRSGSAYDLQHQSVLLHSLEAAAARGVPAAHLAIAKLLEQAAILSADDEDRIKRQVWREGLWTSPFVSFAEIAVNSLRIGAKYRHHLFAAACAGDARAMAETAEHYGDPALLNLAPLEGIDPMVMVELAAEHGQADKVRQWLTIAAEQGDVGAMTELICHHDESAEQAWVWMYLSRLLGHDLSKDRFEAINEDSTPFDDDVGGPAYPVGDSGIVLDSISGQADARAYQLAARIFARIQSGPDRA